MVAGGSAKGKAAMGKGGAVAAGDGGQAGGSWQTATCLFANKFSFYARPHLNPLPLLGEDFH